MWLPPATIRHYYSTIHYIPFAVPFMSVTYLFHNGKPIPPTPLHPFSPPSSPSLWQPSVCKSLNILQATPVIFFYWDWSPGLLTTHSLWKNFIFHLIVPRSHVNSRTKFRREFASIDNCGALETFWTVPNYNTSDCPKDSREMMWNYDYVKRNTVVIGVTESIF